jgi:hypothetical protein
VADRAGGELVAEVSNDDVLLSSARRTGEPAVLVGFHIGSPQAAIPRSGRVHARFEIGGLFNQDCREFGVCGRSGEFEQRRGLTHEIQSAYHGWFPLLPAAKRYAGTGVSFQPNTQKANAATLKFSAVFKFRA